MRRPPPRARMVNMSSVASNQSLKVDATTIAGPLERSSWLCIEQQECIEEPPRDERDDLANAVKKNKFLRVVLVAKLEHDDDLPVASWDVNKGYM
ncbi:hypothetical protein H257_01892 [Aphanomyces astaci]|uniref:Uncharacterized protein n=1 Tax=Aphanomyces astaci TaxID=112090 RepID=W4H4K9_APHAT|nr:hypothetical protein H257_01892 [Aphanomyces astaci]ETV86837.1 hypothetical protein H257_01892 [Aphanomyces astaci]|eukprot:XP_009823636.1 hypothetical protein H257_01892 [Aphanomyces astaci]